MKAIIQKSSQWAAILVAAVVAIITSAVVANATQTITTPNAASISYSLAPGANSAAITPVVSKPVLVMGCCTTNGNVLNTGIGQVSLLHIPTSGAANGFIQWVGLEAAGTITVGADFAAGTHIMFVDAVAQKVDIQVASPDTIRIHNANMFTATGNVTLIW